MDLIQQYDPKKNEEHQLNRQTAPFQKKKSQVSTSRRICSNGSFKCCTCATKLSMLRAGLTGVGAAGATGSMEGVSSQKKSFLGSKQRMTIPTTNGKASCTFDMVDCLIEFVFRYQIIYSHRTLSQYAVAQE